MDSVSLMSKKSLNISFRINIKTMAVICRYFNANKATGESLNIVARKGIEEFGNLLESKYGVIQTNTECFELLRDAGFIDPKKINTGLIKELGLESLNDKSFSTKKHDGISSVMDILKDIKKNG